MAYTAREIASALSNGKETRLGEGQWKSLCPAHNDSTPSMTITDGKSGKILVRCHKGCTGDEIIRALKDRGLWEEYNPKAKHRATWTPLPIVPSSVDDPGLDLKHPKYGTPVKRWTYLNSLSELIGHIYRFEDGQGNKVTIPLTYCINDDKANPAHSWRWLSFDKPRPIYGLDLLEKHPDKKVGIFEGEKSCDAARKLFPDYVCISWPGGGKACRYVDWSPLKGRDVTMWPDADKPGIKAMNDISEILIIEAAMKPKIVQLPPDLSEKAEGWDVADEQPEGFNMDLTYLMETAKPYEPVSEDMIKNMNSRFALVLTGGRAVILRETSQPDNLLKVDFLSVEAFKLFFSNIKVPVGRAFRPYGSYWLDDENRRQYEGIDFAPGKVLKDYYNLWRGFSVEPDATGDWSMLRDHLMNNAASGNEEHFNWIFGWFAQMIQTPWEKIGTSLSFRGKQGTGKTIIGKLFGSLFKQHYTLVDDPRFIFGNFNAHTSQTLLLHSDEGFWGGDPKHVGKLRSMVTSDEQFIEYKGRDPIPVKNYMRLLITTNQNWVVPAASEERRFAVFDMGDGKQQDTDYFRDMSRQMKQGGFAGLLHDLQTFDLTKVNIHEIPNTAALQDQKITSMSTVAKYWHERLIRGEIIPGNGWTQNPLASAMYERFVEETQMWGTRYNPPQSEFYKELRAFLPYGAGHLKLRPGSSKLDWVVGIPPLEDCRNYFDELNNSRFDWLSMTEEMEIKEKAQANFKVGDVEDDIPF